ncbi:MAG: pilus assembly protein PilM [Desulfuromonadaceae bacterium]|nr:pilus assembly protein PilM [Desulfuromonadaceae bacterium]
MFFKKKKDIVGFDIGSSSVKFVYLREAKGSYQLVDFGMAKLSDEAIVDNAIMDSSAVVDAVQELIATHSIKVKNIATSVSGHSVIIRKIQMSIRTEEEMESSIQWEAEQYIPFEISEVNIDYQVLGPDENDASQINVILVAAKKDFVGDYLAVFKECGLTPLVLDIDCFALENAFEANYSVAEDEIVALINMGSEAMNVNVLKGGASVFTRDIQSGGKLYDEEIQKRFGLSAEDAERAKLGEEVGGADPAEVRQVIDETTENLTQEAQRSIDFFSATSADEKVQKVYIAGGVAKVPNVVEMLAEKLGVPVEVIDPFKQIAVDESSFDLDYVADVAPMYVVAVGLAMRRLGDK